MITLAQFFKNLAHGELANIAVGKALLTNDAAEHYEKIINHTQLGLTALHQRFLIRAGQVVIQNYPSIGRYYLTSDYAKSNTSSTQPIKYIEDTTENPFQDNVLKIEQIFDENGLEWAINDSSVPDPIFTPEYNCIAMTPGGEGTYWSINYRADHEVIPTDTTDPTAVTLHIPAQYQEPLQTYVAARIMSSRGHSLFDGQIEGDRLMMRYEMLCALLEQQNMDIDDNDTHTRLEDNGWA